MTTTTHDHAATGPNPASGAPRPDEMPESPRHAAPSRTSDPSSRPAGPDATPPAPAGPGRAALILRRTGARVLSALGVIWAAATATFFIQALLPGDRATLLLNQLTGQIQERTAGELAPINAKYGFDNPLLVQYLDFLRGLLRGDLGMSYQLYKPVTEVVGDQVLPTIALTFSALAVAWVIATLFTIATVKRVPWLSSLASAIEAFAAGLPQYWLGVILLVVFALGLGAFPVVGGTGVASLVLPALTLGIPLAGFLGQTIRSEFAAALEQPFTLTARLRGMGDTQVRLRHVLRHSVLPGITLSGWAMGSLFSGAVIAENIFSRPGLGKVLVTAVNSRDLPVVCGIVILVAVIYVVANLLVDLAYTLIDPRMKQG